MSIAQFATVRPRTRIALVGRVPNDQWNALFAGLGYEVRSLTEAELADEKELALIDSAVLFQDVDQPSRIQNLLATACPPLMRQGCRIYVGPAVADIRAAHFRQMVVNAVVGLELPVVGIDGTSRPAEVRESAEQPVCQPCVHVLTDVADWDELARLITCNPADAPANPATTINVVDPCGNPAALHSKHNLAAEAVTLVRRAFCDCAHVHMIREADGLSEAPVFRAYVELTSGVLGKFPYLHFVKLGERAKIQKEYQQYCSTAMEYIPFHLGPRLRRDRCALGHNLGVIVGDYVIGAEKLRDCAKDGRATHVIANLFNHTLHAWRVTAQESAMSLADALAAKWPSKIPEWRESNITTLGGKRPLSELKDMFLKVAQGRVLVGSIHGDLHATNVLARLSDGIVIDFEKVELSKPLVFDPASLESGLFIDGFIGDPRSPEQLLASVMPMYEARCFRNEGEPCHPGDRSAWFFDCVRQIRMHARQMELAQFQYASALALCFIKKSCNDKPFAETGQGLSRETLRAMAFVIGQRILEKLIEAAD